VVLSGYSGFFHH